MAGIAAALGDGPIYPWGNGVIPISEFRADADGRFWIKVVWLVDLDRYQGGLALIRGQRLDDATPLFFSAATGDSPTDELRLSGDSQQSAGQGFREFGSYTVLSSIGCYGYQVDMFGLQETVIFEVR